MRFKLGAKMTPSVSLWLAANHDIVTERAKYWLDENLRVDAFEVTANAKKRFTLVDRLSLDVTATAGALVVGHVGGVEIQQAWHTLPFIHARTLGNGLQDTYEGGLNVAPLVGLSAGLEYRPFSWLTLEAEVDGKAAYGALHTVGAQAGARVHAPETWVVRPEIGATARGVWYDVVDPRLAIPGGYVSGAHFTPVLSAGLGVGPVTVGFDLLWNVGGAGPGMGEVKLAFAL